VHDRARGNRLTIIQRRGGPQFEALLRRFGIKSTPDAEIADDITSVASVPRLDYPCMGRKLVTGTSADRSQVQVLNPANSGIISHVHRVWVASEAADTIELTMRDVALVTNDFGIVVWRPDGTQPNPATQFRSASATEVGTIFMTQACDIAARTYVVELDSAFGDYEHPGVALDEGSGMVVQSGTDDLNLDVSIFWSERLKY